MKFAVGLFTITLFILLFASLFFILKNKGTFEDRYSYHFTTYSAEYFNVGMPLKFSGFNIGAIDNILLNNDGSVYITFSVNKSNKKWISEGSVLMSTRPLIGQAYIELYTSLGTPPLENDSSLMLLSNDSINDLIKSLNPVVKKAINVLNNINIITSDLAKNDSDFRQTLQNLNKFSKKLANDDSLLTSVTGNKESTQNIISSLNKTIKIMQDVEKITHDISTITSSLDKMIVSPASSSLNDLDLIMKDVKRKLDVIDGTVKAIGTYDKELIEIKEQISVGLVKSNQIIDKVDNILSDKKNEEIVLP